MSTAELFSVAGKVALVTGGSRGIGRMMARALVVGGARVYITSRRGCDEVARELCREGECVAVKADLTSESDLRGLAAAIRSAEPELHVLVHSAGAHYTAPLEDHASSAWDEAWSTNVKSLFRLVQELLPQLEGAAHPEDPARVIALGSAEASRVPQMDVYAYGASKAGLNHLVAHLARKLARRSITVNAIAPGAFPTDMLRPALEQFGEEAVTRQIPLRRFGGPTDAEAAILYLASRAGAYVTGAILPVDGGLALVT